MDKQRGNGQIPIISIDAKNLAEATHKAIIACHDYGCRVETPKHKAGGSLGYDADMTIRVQNPDAEPKVHYIGVSEDGRGLMQYILEVTHGIHNHWKKDAEHPERWGYTYNERFVDQIPFILQRIKADWDKRKRISGRDYQFGIWRAGEDIILEQEDPPCFQRGQFRFIEDAKGNLVMNYQTDWRSRDLMKAWNENNIGQVELMKLVARKVSFILGQPIKLGAYIDHSSSLHLYGLYVDRDGLEKHVKRMKKTSYRNMSTTLDQYFTSPDGFNAEQLKRIIACQSHAERAGDGLNLAVPQMEELGFNSLNHPYPREWDTWPKSWDATPDPTKLARVP